MKQEEHQLLQWHPVASEYWRETVKTGRGDRADSGV